MPTSSFPVIPSNLPPESQRWGRDGVEATINYLLAQVSALQTQVQTLGAKR